MTVTSHAGDFAQKLLAKARARADAAEVIYQESDSRGVSYQDNRLKTGSSSAVRGVGLRVIHKGRVGFSCTNDCDSTDLLVSNALDSAAFGQEAAFQFPGTLADAPEVKVHDEAVGKLTMERAAEIMNGGIAAILQDEPEAHCGGGISAEGGMTVICNSAGLHHEEVSSTFEMSIGAFLVRGESFLWVDEGEESSRFSDDIQRHVAKVKDWIRLSRREVRVGDEELPVLFTPKALGFLLDTFEMNTNGKLVQKGASVLAKRLGEQVLDPRVTLLDDPLVDYAAGSMSVDAEGVASRRKALFEKGVLRQFIYDLQTASVMHAQTTGNGMRGYSSLPRPGNTNLRLGPGETPLTEIIRGIKRGLLLEAALGAGQSNVLAGAFSVNVELGFLIENGEVVGRVKDCMLAGNAFDAFNHIRAISSETEWHGSLEAPAICFESLSVTGKKAE